MRSLKTATSLFIIQKHLSPDEEGFLYHLHEDLFFNYEKYSELLKAIKDLKIHKFNPQKTQIEFTYNLYDRLTYMYDILRDLYVHPNKVNIGIDRYYEYLLELKYEILSLFNENIIEDYHGNKYE